MIYCIFHIFYVIYEHLKYKILFKYIYLCVCIYVRMSVATAAAGAEQDDAVRLREPPLGEKQNKTKQKQY